jgi:hypothetical protein
LAIGKEGQNARLAARLTGWRVDIKSETQLAEEEAYANQDWAEGEWIVDPESGEQVWQPAEGGEAMSAEAYAQASDTPEDALEAAIAAEVVAEIIVEELVEELIEEILEEAVIEAVLEEILEEVLEDAEAEATAAADDSTEGETPA